MDCFYAQCETVRLGLDQSVPLALVQWNSALAVNYPARKFGIKRGDSFENIREKSNGECIAIHLPVTTIASLSPQKSYCKTYDNSGADCEDDDKERTGRNVRNEDKCVNDDIRKADFDGCKKSDPDGTGVLVPPKKQCYFDGSCQGGKAIVNDDDENTDKENFEYVENENQEDDDDFQSSKAAYEKEFNQPDNIREEMFMKERNKMRSPKEGKACLDRYRLASARIFSLIEETLAETIGKKKFILERASIDELFIDITAFCYPESNTQNDAKVNANAAEDNEELVSSTQFLSNIESDSHQSWQETIKCHETVLHPSDLDCELGRALRLGCHVARTVRCTVFETLGFTLSAGISTNKLVAKLTASYGKPNGQAVVYPSAIPKTMEETQIRKARMLGGKMGKKVQSLLPESETTMGAIARLLTLDDLIKAIGDESGRWVFDACRGICHEVVRPTLKVLPKSITAFKSFPAVTYPELNKWTALLVTDIMKRVDTDTKRNSRAPKSISVGYTMTPGGAWIGRTFRLPFPADKDFNSRVQKLVTDTRRVLNERGHSSIIRIGFSAIDFVNRPKHGIDTFFSTSRSQLSPAKKMDNISTKNNPRKNTTTKSAGINCYFPEKSKSSNEFHHDVHSKTTVSDEEFARQVQKSFDDEVKSFRTPIQNESQIPVASISKTEDVSRDESIALQLQTEYDRENRVLSDVERFSSMSKRKGRNISSGRHQKLCESKSSKIDSFFRGSKTSK